VSPAVTKQFRTALSSAPTVGRLDAMLKPSRGSNSTLETVQRFVRIPSASVGALVLMVLLLAAVLAPVLTSYDSDAISPRDAYSPPSTDHPMGTDKFGRDVFTRVLFGGRISLTVGFVATVIGGGIGLLLGMIASYFVGIIDEIIMRLLDIMLAFPDILLSMGIVALLGPSMPNVIIAVGLSYVAGFARIMRGSVLSVKAQDHILAAHALGCRPAVIMWRHILPNIMAPLIVYGTLSVASAILAAAGLSFLGLGAQPPTPEWGIMLSDGRETLNRAWWVSLFPGLAILVTTLSINFLGDGLRIALDPRVRAR
jgi:peptide/nickel transport system permease protein